MVDTTIGRLWESGVWVMLLTDLVWGRIFFQNSLELEIFSPAYNGVKIFFSIIRHERYFFSVQDIFSPGIYLHAFFLSK